MIGAILAAAGSLIGGASSAAVGLGSSILGGVGSLVSGGVSAVGGLGSSLFGPSETIGERMTAIANPYYYDTAAGGGVMGGLSAISGQLAEILPVVGSAMDIIRPAKQTVTTTGRQTTLPAKSNLAANLPTLPMMNLAGGQPVFSTPGIVADGRTVETPPDYLLYAMIAIIAIMFLRKK